MSDDVSIPIVEEQATVAKRLGATEHVTVATSTSQDHVVVRDSVRHEHVEVTRVPVDREVATAPEIRVDGDLTIISVMEERLVVEKRLFVVEELHLRRITSIEPVELPVTLRRTEVEVERTTSNNQEII